MKRFVQLITAGVALLILGTSVLLAQEVTFGTGPALTPSGILGANGGFAWGDVDGNGFLDLLIPANALMLNSGGSAFTAASSTAVSAIPTNTNTTPVLLADFDGNGYPDVLTTNNGVPALVYDSLGVFSPAANTGDFTHTKGTWGTFAGATVADIDHSNYLSIAWAGPDPGGSGGANSPTKPYGGVVLLKGSATGFTNEGSYAASGNLKIDTSLTFEDWTVRFVDANNDGYPDLLMGSFRDGFSRIDTGSSGSRKGCVLFMNDGTGKFIVPTSATISRKSDDLSTVRFLEIFYRRSRIVLRMPARMRIQESLLTIQCATSQPLGLQSEILTTTASRMSCLLRMVRITGMAPVTMWTLLSYTEKETVHSHTNGIIPSA